MKPPLLAPLVLSAFVLGAALHAEQLPTTVRKPGEDVNSADLRMRQSLTSSDTMLFNGWGVSPAGAHVACGDLALKIVIAPDRKAAIAVCAGYNKQGVNVVSLDAKRESQFIAMKQAFNGLAFSRDGKKFYVSGGDSGTISIFNYADGKATLDREVKPEAGTDHVFLAGIAVHPATGALYVCNEANHEVWLLNADTLAREQSIATGQHPHSCVVGGDGKHLYVSNWGSRSVSVIDMKKGQRMRDITVGVRPNDMALAPDGRLFIACSGDNTVHVIGTGKLEKAGPDASPARPLWADTREVISTSLYPQSPEGSTPCSVAVSADGKTLFVANADNNDVVVVDISGNLAEEAKERGERIAVVDGFIPTGWYPSAVCPTPDGNFLIVANGKGLTSRANAPARSNAPSKQHTGILYDHPGRTFEGSLSFIAKPDAKQMAAYTEQVRRNSPYHPEHFAKAALPSETIIPAKVGEQCAIKYVLYIIKENRTYDQVMSDATDAQGRAIGNGDKSLLMYGAKVTPNQHQIAREYVLFDNMYCNSEVSVDGHSWTDAAIATDFNQRSWIMSYSKHGKVPGNEEMETPANGYLWDLCRRHGVSYRNYGEGAQRVPSANRGKWPRDFQQRDMDRVKIWIDDLHKAEKSGELPRFTIMALGENHTKGTTAGANTPEACVGSNDLGLGRIVEAASHSKFWKEMAIFVIEDDAQNGPDHVDAHRTTAFVISPFCKRGVVDSTLYTMASMIRTMELILGLPPLTQYDAGATPMFNAFTREAKLSEYTALTPEIDLNAKNTAKTAFSKESGRMNFKAVDLAPEDELNRILWAVARPGEPYPTPIHRAIFVKPIESR